MLLTEMHRVRSHLLMNIGYANPELVNHLYEEFRKKRYDLDLMRKKRNEHAAA
jgi:hypothetical protein